MNATVSGDSGVLAHNVGMIQFAAPMSPMSASTTSRPLMMMAFALGLATVVPVLVLIAG
jgi:hypothetical protein